MSKLSKIIDAIRDTDDLTLLEFEIINQGIDINEPLEYTSLLGFICELGNLRLVKILLEQGADPNFCIEDDPDFMTPLMAAVCGGNLEVVKTIVNAGADVNYVQEAGDYALALAASGSDREIFNYLAPLTLSNLRKQASKELESTLSSNNLPSKLEQDFFEKITSIILGYYQDYEPEILALQDMIRNRVNVNAVLYNKTCLINIVGRDRLEITEILLKAGANPNFCPEGIPALVEAIWKGSSIEEIKMLIEAGADVNLPIIERTELKEQACHPDFYNRTPLMIVANQKIHDDYPEEKRNNISILKMLIEAGADVNAQDNDGKTALSLAKEVGNTEIVQLLTDAGAKDN